MNYYAGALLLNCKNVEAFQIMSYLLTVPIINACFNVDMRRLAIYSQIFDDLLGLQSAKLQKHLQSCGYQYVTYIFDVVAGLFCLNFPYNSAVKVWDYILESPELGIFRVGVAVFRSLESEIMEKSAEDIMMLVKSPCEHVDVEVILKNIAKMEIPAKTYDKIKEKRMAEADINRRAQ